MKPIRLLAAVFVVTALVFLGLLLRSQIGDLRELGVQARSLGWGPRPAWLLAGLALATGNLFLMAGVWVRLFRSLGGTIPLRDGIRVWVVTNLGRYIPGKVWQLTGLAAYMREREGKGAVALSSAVVFQVVTIGTGSVVGAALLGGQLAGTELVSVPTIVSLVLLLALAMNPTIVHAATSRIAGWMGEGVEVGRLRGVDLAHAGIGMVCAWIVYGLGFWCVARGLGVTTIGPALATGGFAASYVIGYLALIAPGGLVVREGALTVLLAGVGAVPAAGAAILAIVARVWTTASELLALLVVAVVGRKPS